MKGQPTTPLLRMRQAGVRYDRQDVPALNGVDLDVAEREIVCVLGPSGSGKSTLLRSVAGLNPMDTGRVLLDGADQAGVPVHRRGVGLMFQEQALFPQRDVAGNIGFGLRMRRVPRGAARHRVARLLDLVGMPGAQRRPVGELSGGEQQRVALARALAPEPRLLMLDEPFGQLDRSLRERLVVELRELFVELGTTVLAVTHDQSEAFALADRVVVMRDGRVEQSGSPQQVWQYPASVFVARFLGFGNIVDATLETAPGADDGGTVTAQGVGAARSPWGAVPVSPCASTTGSEPRPGDDVAVLVRPGGVLLGEEQREDTLAAVVAGRTFHGDLVTVLLAPEHGPRLEASCRLRDAPSPGTKVVVSFDPDEVVVLPRDAEPAGAHSGARSDGPSLGEPSTHLAAPAAS